LKAFLLNPIPTLSEDSMKLKFALGTFLALALGLTACQPGTAPATEMPTVEPTTDAYAADTLEAPSGAVSLDVSDQSIEQGTVTVRTVDAMEDGWVVIHTEADGKPGPVIGYTQIPAGESTEVKVTVDASQATPKLFAMLHVDEGIKGTYEFPGADAPVKDGDMIVMQAFNQVDVTISLPYITAKDQSIVDGTVWVAASMDVPGWVAIHADADGKPGPVIGYAQIPAGDWEDLKVTVDESKVTPKLFAMLHIDAGIAGTYEFPGEDVPVKNGETIVMVPFEITN
jgi:hypothetical protein